MPEKTSEESGEQGAFFAVGNCPADQEDDDWQEREEEIGESS